MVLQMTSGEYLSGRESAYELDMAYGTFKNQRTDHGDRFLKGHDLVPGRVFFRVEDVRRLAAERAR